MLRKLEGLALGLGAPGLFLLAVVDSSFITLPEVVDILVVWMVIEHPSRWLWYGLTATAGSIAGLYVLYALARRGGETFLKKRLKERHVARVMEVFKRRGALALVVTAVMPPPVPFKPFVLMAGVAAMPLPRFLIAITIGRGIRYVGEALLALWYGQRAVTYINENLAQVSLMVGTAVVTGALAYYGYRKVSRRR